MNVNKRFEEFKEFMYSNKPEYGTVLNYTLVDNRFDVAYLATAEGFTFLIMENETIIHEEGHNPIHDPIFGLDVMEWQDLKDKSLDIIDAFTGEKQ